MIFSKQSGSGDTVVLIHGFCETHAIWENIVPELEKTHHVVAIDLPGFGESDLKENEISIDQIGDQVYQYLIQLGIKKCVMVGHSLGGYITLAIAKKSPDILDGFCLFHSTAYSDSLEKKMNREKSIVFIKKHGVAPFTNAFVPSLFADNEHPSIAKLLHNAKQTSLETVLKYTNALKNRLDRTDVLKSFDRPILIVSGTKDMAVPLKDNIEQSALTKHGYFEKFKNVGHMGMYELPTESSTILTQFVSICINF
ncbi:MAG: alpha/beta hydrolase [Cyclobacteriaceae bacterium]|nr:alpha/beta hydrolase [Cyclobacteriaceae bacterium]